MKCDLCAVESQFDAAFIKQRKSFTRRTKNFCPKCWVARNHKRGLRNVLAIPVMALAGYALKTYTADALQALGEFLLAFALIQFFLILSIFPHELGHALTARALGWRVAQITIGVGKQIWKRRWKGTLIDLRQIPIAGAAFLVPRGAGWFRLKYFLSIAAGPLVNGLMAWGVIIAFGGSVLPLDIEALPHLAQLFVLANAVVLLLNLWPHQPKAGMGLASDGKQLLQIISFRKKALDQLRARRFVYEAELCRERGDFAAARAWCEKGLALYPNDTGLLTWSGIALLDAQDYAGARAVFLKQLELEKPGSPIRPILMNNVAYAGALSGNEAWLPEADAYSQDAFTILPWSTPVMGTRGTVLVALGKYPEGIELLKKSMEDADVARNKSDNACHLAIAFAKMGQPEEAGKYLELAAQLDPQCPLLKQAGKCVEETGTKGAEAAGATTYNRVA